MARDDFDSAEVNRLVKELEARRAPRPAVVPPAPATSASAIAEPAPMERRVHAPGRRWTTARLLMPAAPTTTPRKAFAFASAIHLPALPRLALPVLTEPQWSLFTARLFVALGGVLGAAMLYWPYANACSWGLGLYLSAVLLVVVTGTWGAKLTWDARLGVAHVLAIGIVCWGLALVAAEVLPRVGYGQAPAVWVCS